MIESGLADKTALITGANAGIGAATARALAAQGATVTIHYLDSKGVAVDDYEALHTLEGRAAAEAVLFAIEEKGGRAYLVEGDLSQPEQHRHIFDAAERAGGPVDILINNAAHCEAPDNIHEITAGTIDRTFGVNVRGSVRMIAEYVRRFKTREATWGRIVNFSTDAAQCFVGQINYGASKATLEAFTRSLAHEIGPLGITINTVAPGPVQTGYITPELEEQLLPDIPMRRLGQPEDIANAILFLVSDGASWVTGNVLKVSGGHALG